MNNVELAHQVSEDELNAAKQLCKSIGVYKWLSAIELKGDEARKHVGLTVQKAISILEDNNLSPFDYGFVCYDEWDDVIEEDVVVLESGDRYGFRYNELSMLMIAGIESRLSLLE